MKGVGDPGQMSLCLVVLIFGVWMMGLGHVRDDSYIVVDGVILGLVGVLGANGARRE